MKVEGIKMDPLFFEDVELGTEIGPLVKEPFTQSNMAAFAAVFGSFCPGHFDYHFAKEHFNLPAPFAYGAQVTTWLGQLLTDWIGPNCTLKKLRSQTREPLYAGESLTIKGTVVKKYVKDSENYLECEIWAQAQDGRVVNPGSATVTVTSRSPQA